jgi:hypothetical protein
MDDQKLNLLNARSNPETLASFHGLLCELP